MAKVGVLGCGAWGTTIAKIIAENNHELTIWCHDQAIADGINNSNENNKLLAGIKLPSNLKATTELSAAVAGQDLVIIVTASQFFYQTALNIKPFLSADTLLLSATKGLHEEKDQRMSEVLLEIFPEHKDKIAVLSGPNISWEIANKQPATAVVASNNQATAHKIQQLINSNYFRIYTNNDIIGTELGGTLKNIIAIAAGICDGLGFGSNARSALMVRGMAEMTRLAITLGAKAETLMGLTGMGDLITTCSSSLSRNHFVGENLAKGKHIEQILAEMSAVAEGVTTAKAALKLAQKHNIPMPITEKICEVIYENKNITEALEELMNRDLKAEY